MIDLWTVLISTLGVKTKHLNNQQFILKSNEMLLLFHILS
jgi:hypothetical protein